MALKAVFSEGRTLCVRFARPHECRGIPFAADGLTMSRWPGGGDVGVGVMPSLRACGARPSAGMGYPGSDGLTGETRDGAQVVFSEGRTLCVRVARPDASQRIPSQPDGSTMSRWPGGGEVGVGVMPSLRACGARPSGGRQAQDAWPNGENREITRKAVFSEGRGLRARGAGPEASRG